MPTLLYKIAKLLAFSENKGRLEKAPECFHAIAIQREAFFRPDTRVMETRKGAGAGAGCGGSGATEESPD